MKNSVIFRGSLVYDKHPKNYLKESIKILREWFDGEVIVSTWKHQEKHLIGIDGIDKIVLSEDPREGPIQQLKRQIISYEKGLDVASGNLILVTRTDFIHRKNIFEYHNSLPKFDEKFKILKEKLLIGNMMSINPVSNELPNTFRLCDWFQLGNSEDINNWGRVYQTMINSNIDYNCTEKNWFVYFLLKNNVKNIENNTYEIDSFYWDYILSNFVIKNTITTLNSHNMNWSFQPEKLDCYLTEEIYNNKYNLKFNN
jgi:hypothetical protein